MQSRLCLKWSARIAAIDVQQSASQCASNRIKPHAREDRLEVGPTPITAPVNAAPAPAGVNASGFRGLPCCSPYSLLVSQLGAALASRQAAACTAPWPCRHSWTGPMIDAMKLKGRSTASLRRGLPVASNKSAAFGDCEVECHMHDAGLYGRFVVLYVDAARHSAHGSGSECGTAGFYRVSHHAQYCICKCNWKITF